MGSVKAGVIMLLGVGLAAAQPARQVNSVPAVPQSAPPPPQQAAPATGTGWREYDDLMRRRGEVQKELLARHDEMMAKYGRNDGPEARAVLEPIRQKLREIDVQEKRLLECESEKVTNAPAIFTALKIKTNKMGVVDGDSLQAYIESRVMDGTLTPALKERFFLIVKLRSRGVMNPSSRGAGQIANAIAGTLRCFAIDTPSSGARAGAPKRTTEPLLLAKKLASDARVSFYSYHMPYIGNTEGRFAPILVHSDGGSLIVGTTSDIPPGGKYEIGKSHAVVIRLDPRGKIAWQKKLDKKGFKDYEGGSAVQTADGGFIVFVLSYVHPARGAVSRFIKFNAKGKLVWERQLRGDGSVNSPFPSKLVQLTPKGSIKLVGHIYIDPPNGRDRPLHAWIGEIDKNGKLIADKVDPVGTGGANYFGGNTYGGLHYGGSMYGGMFYGGARR